MSRPLTPSCRFREELLLYLNMWGSITSRKNRHLKAHITDVDIDDKFRTRDTCRHAVDEAYIHVLVGLLHHTHSMYSTCTYRYVQLIIVTIYFYIIHGIYMYMYKLLSGDR